MPKAEGSAAVPEINLRGARINSSINSGWRGASEAHMFSTMKVVAAKRTPCDMGIDKLYAIWSIREFGFPHLAGRAPRLPDACDSMVLAI